MRVVVDHRENAEDIILELQNRGHEVNIETLKAGDYKVDDLLVVERKTLLDFATSILDGRLFQQANRLVYQKEKACLILEGTSKELKNIHVSRAAMQGALTTISLVYGLPVLRSANQKETAGLIEIAARQLASHRSGALKRPGYRPKGERKQKLYFLQGLPGIGPDKAEQLLNHFGSIDRIIESEIQELQEVPSIGPHTAKNLYKIVREPKNEYIFRQIPPGSSYGPGSASYGVENDETVGFE